MDLFDVTDILVLWVELLYKDLPDYHRSSRIAAVRILDFTGMQTEPSKLSPVTPVMSWLRIIGLYVVVVVADVIYNVAV